MWPGLGSLKPLVCVCVFYWRRWCHSLKLSKVWVGPSRLRERGLSAKRRPCWILLLQLVATQTTGQDRVLVGVQFNSGTPFEGHFWAFRSRADAINSNELITPLKKLLVSGKYHNRVETTLAQLARLIYYSCWRAREFSIKQRIARNVIH